MVAEMVYSCGQIKKQKEINAGVSYFSPFFLLQPGPQTHGMLLPTFKVPPPTVQPF